MLASGLSCATFDKISEDLSGENRRPPGDDCQANYSECLTTPLGGKTGSDKLAARREGNDAQLRGVRAAGIFRAGASFHFTLYFTNLLGCIMFYVWAYERPRARRRMSHP